MAAVKANEVLLIKQREDRQKAQAQWLTNRDAMNKVYLATISRAAMQHRPEELHFASKKRDRSEGGDSEEEAIERAEQAQLNNVYSQLTQLQEDDRHFTVRAGEEVAWQRGHTRLEQEVEDLVVEATLEYSTLSRGSHLE